MIIFIGVDRNKTINLSPKLILKNINIIIIAQSMCQENYIFKVMNISQSLFSLTHTWSQLQIWVYSFVLLISCDRSYEFEVSYR